MGRKTLLDGALGIFGDDLNNDVTMNDCRKMLTGGVNLSLVRNDALLSVERRNYTELQDTLFLRSNFIENKRYELEVNADPFLQEGRTVLIEDLFQKSKTELKTNSTAFEFAVTDEPATRAPDRFRVIIGAKIKMVPAPIIATVAEKPGISVYPNPVVNRTLNFQFGNKATSKYVLTMTTPIGQMILRRTINVTDPDSVKTLLLPANASAGRYQLTFEDAAAKTETIMVSVM
jgi:hypothetical protein